MVQGFSYSVRGASHEESGLVCQDSSAHVVGNGYAAAIVADGHGSKKHFRSNIGSKLAVEATMATIARFYADPAKLEANISENYDRIIRNIQKQIISNWNVRIAQHLQKNPLTKAERKPFTPAEFSEIAHESYYGTTLLVAVMGNGYSFGFQIGDGSMVGVFADGTTRQLIDYEESNPANITASLCNSNAAAMFGSYYIENSPMLALYASTDGLYTSFGSDKDFLAYHRIITGQLAESEQFADAVVKNLIKRSHYGTQDDISLACVYDRAQLSEKAAVLAAR